MGLLLFIQQVFSELDAEAGVFEAAFFVFGFGQNGGDGAGALVFVEGDEGEVGGGGDDLLGGVGVFADYADTDFHGCAADIIDGCFEDDVVADADGLFEGERVDAGGDDLFAAMTLGGH